MGLRAGSALSRPSAQPGGFTHSLSWSLASLPAHGVLSGDGLYQDPCSGLPNHLGPPRRDKEHPHPNTGTVWQALGTPPAASCQRYRRVRRAKRGLAATPCIHRLPSTGWGRTNQPNSSPNPRSAGSERMKGRLSAVGKGPGEAPRGSECRFSPTASHELCT